MGILKSIAGAGAKVVGGAAKATGKVVGGVAKTTGKVVGGAANIFVKGTALEIKRAPSHVVGHAILRSGAKHGMNDPAFLYGAGYKEFVGGAAIGAVTGGLHFISRHKKGVFIAGATIATANSVNNMMLKRDKSISGELDEFDDDYKMSINQYKLKTRSNKLHRIC